MPRSAAATSPLGFRRTTVADQAAAALQSAIERGELTNPLPGELTLARRLGVSRPSLHGALEQLERLGLVEIRVGRRTRILARGRWRSSRPARQTLAILSVGPDEAQFMSQTPLILHLHAEAVRRGLEWEPIFETGLAVPAAVPRLRQLVTNRRNTCWVLYSCPGWLQRWFAEARVPTLVLGSCARDVTLPSVDLDFWSVGWHAAGMLARHGHRAITLVLPAAPLPGDLACREGFLDYFSRLRPPHVRVNELAVAAPAPRALARLRYALTGPKRSTAVFVMREAVAVSAYVQVLALGLAVPRDVSVLSRDNHPLIHAALPQLTRYSASPLKHATLAIRTALAIFRGSAGRPRPRLVTPQFVVGSTLGAAPMVNLPE
ncbi:MAG: substrate-binding domain-containing protein [Opitutaceae bacterium]|nr:substrate-binding domain-containing protein [Opitutaceae bacterium]